jgi:hypothetical protein
MPPGSNPACLAGWHGRSCGTYILCRLGGFQAIAQAVQAQGWDYYELETGHDAPITMPDELARVLDATAGSTRG